MMNNKGFTLIEVLAVVAIIAIVGLIATPSVIQTLNMGKDTSDEILYDNIKTAIQTMYEEKYYNGSKFNYYDKNGVDGEVSLVDNKIEINLQTLVGNGFLIGVNNEKVSDVCDEAMSINCNKKIVVNADGKDISLCNVSITKKVSANGKVCYEVNGSDVEDCPTYQDFGGDKQCN